ncbi:hypothetical protein H9Y04_35465 [Streptomyces sp. TRM66268-LWL]|uniref:Uncharacterized protein n=1 Tax=Streptomyces polyasparticus TaxID=2767826 RepID=A0ABR7SR07_9ACTN|nr:hypothetical protein [Streptomyces polyasparticus]MBC9717844.1 hypothetical protein [Streptomyces polyasparticus]
MTLTADDYAYLTSELGPVPRSELEVRHGRLGSLTAVAIEVLRERRAMLIADPLTVTVQGVATVSNVENVRALERQLVSLEQAEKITPPPPRPTFLVRRPAR